MMRYVVIIFYEKTVILVRDDEVILEDEPLESEQEIKILSVISGG